MTTTATFKPLDAIEAFITRFVVFADETHPRILALWILHTYAFDAAYSTPYIYINSAEPQSGKTLTLDVCNLLARNAEKAGGITSAALFRLIESQSPTLMIDEVDTIFTGGQAKEDLRGVLNNGYKHGAYIWRSVGTEAERFATFCPKLLAGIDNAGMPETLRDRCIPIILKRKRTDERTERFYPERRHEAEASELKANLRKWAMQNAERIMDAPDPEYIDGISDRKYEIAEPLLVLAGVCGKAYVKRTREALLKLLAGERPKATIGVRVLEMARELMDAAGSDRILSDTLASTASMTPKKLSAILAPYGITPSTIRHGETRGKGYHRADFIDAWTRYLAPPEAE